MRMHKSASCMLLNSSKLGNVVVLYYYGAILIWLTCECRYHQQTFLGGVASSGVTDGKQALSVRFSLHQILGSSASTTTVSQRCKPIHFSKVETFLIKRKPPFSLLKGTCPHFSFFTRRIPIRTFKSLKRAIEKGLPLSLLDVRGNLHPSRSSLNPMFLFRLKAYLESRLASNFTDTIAQFPQSNATSTLKAHTSSPSTDASQDMPSITKIPLPFQFSPASACNTDEANLLCMVNAALDTFHPVLRILHKRKLEGSKPGNRTDAYKVGLAIEGGGMRGCIAAGMTVALYYMGYADCFDVIYGSSAGSLIGAFLVSRQLPYDGSQIYYQWLPAAGHRFINFSRMGRSVGLGPLVTGDIKDFIIDKLGKPALNLDILLKDIIQRRQPLNWERFWENNKNQPLRIVVSGLVSENSVLLDSNHNNFNSMDELSECIRGSMLLPGISGPLVRLPATASNVRQTIGPIFKNRMMRRFTEAPMVSRGEPMADAMLYEPIPYRSALKENCTHILALRTQPDNRPVSRTGGLDAYVEQCIAKRYFKVKNKLANIYEHIKNKRHRFIYMEDILTLNEATNEQKSMPNARGDDTFLYAVALLSNETSISRTQTNAEVIYEGIRKGFAQVYNNLVENPDNALKGYQEAKKIFSDKRLAHSKKSWHQLTKRSAQTVVPDEPPEAVWFSDDTTPLGTVDDLILYAQQKLSAGAHARGTRNADSSSINEVN